MSKKKKISTTTQYLHEKKHQKYLCPPTMARESVFIDQWETWCKGYAACVCVWMGYGRGCGQRQAPRLIKRWALVCHRVPHPASLTGQHDVIPSLLIIEAVQMFLTRNSEHATHLCQELSNYLGPKHINWTLGSIPCHCTNRSMGGLWRRYEFGSWLLLPLKATTSLETLNNGTSEEGIEGEASLQVSDLPCCR